MGVKSGDHSLWLHYWTTISNNKLTKFGVRYRQVSAVYIEGHNHVETPIDMHLGAAAFHTNPIIGAANEWFFRSHHRWVKQSGFLIYCVTCLYKSGCLEPSNGQSHVHFDLYVPEWLESNA